MSKRLTKQWRWVGAGLVVVVLAIMSRNVDVDLGSAGQSPQCEVEVNVDVLNVRAGPSTDTPSVDRLSRGDVVDALPETSNGFRKLGVDRWVAMEFVTSNAHCG